MEFVLLVGQLVKWVTINEVPNEVVYPKFGTAKFNLLGVEYKGFKLDDMEIECVMPRSEEYEQGSRKPICIFGFS